MSERNVIHINEMIEKPKYKLISILGQGAYAVVRLGKSNTG